ncbi:YggS family pyridoxal phosphate-dependent enzyme [Oligella urethralis]|uniref:YggS family pyridoxal phosphate-dependent enzyme n=1 Tax=Oligella urethralis TaxID=90245 RepID=UPI000E03D5FF|nr:YggS family pyridoxal phosphate-dependent enzyme [Oligella urethralis]SUA55261.1 Predicted enzyme with a TIM-barrel fold [Oligella urethralis]
MALFAPEKIKENFELLAQRIAVACERVGRSPDELRVIPVTKEFAPTAIEVAYANGYKQVGENKVQELVDKYEALKRDGAYADLELILIGHLQSNKARFLADYVSEFHALDSLRLAARVNRFMAEAGRVLPIYVQVNTSLEQSKYGLLVAETLDFIDECAAFSHLRVVGLMTLAMNSKNEEEVRQCFRTLRQLRDQAQLKHPAVRRLSMGMSGDFEIAIEEGATDIRVGQMIFGSRDIPNELAHFWPEDRAR